MKLFRKIKLFVSPYLPHVFWVVFVLLALSKIILVSHNEILALYMPHDDLWHITTASKAFWFAKDYNQMTFIQYPIYALFIFATHFTGIPLRISIELLFILSGFLFSFSLIKLGLNKILGILCFALIVFQPVSFSLFDHTLAETLYSPLLLLSLASFFQLWQKRNEKNAFFFPITTGLFLSLLWLTRKESLLIAIFLFFVTLVILGMALRKKHPLKKTFIPIKNVVLIPFSIIIFSFLLICTANYSVFGIFALSELDATGYKSAYQALQQIQIKNSPRYVPVSSEAREIAYSVSPALRKLQPYLEDRNNFAFFWTKKAQGIENEMAAGWFYWLLRDAVYNAGYRTSSSADAFYGQIATEINSAIKEKRIASRFVLFDFIDPSFYKYLPDFPASFLKISGLFFNTQNPPAEFDDPNLTENNRNLIDALANRRATLVNQRQNKNSTIGGWAFSNNETLISVALIDQSGKILQSTEIQTERPDVKDFHAKNNLVAPLKSGFDLSFPGDRSTLSDSQLEFTTTKGVFQAPINSLKKNTQTEIKNENGTLLFSIERKDFFNPKKFEAIAKDIQHFAWRIYGKIVFALSLLSLMIIILILIKIKQFRPDKLTIFSSFIFFLILTRLCLFSLIDIASWNGSQPRYIFPIMPLYSTLLLLIISQGIGLFSGKKTKLF